MPFLVSALARGVDFALVKKRGAAHRVSRSGIVHCLLRPTADETEQPDYREDDNDDDDDKQPTDEDAPPITGLLW